MRLSSLFSQKNLLILFTLSLGAISSIILAIEKSFAGDEAATLRILLDYSLIDISKGINGEYNPPLFFILLKIITDFTGLSQLSIRSLSIFFYLGSILVVYKILKFHNVRKLRHWPLIIFTFSPIVVFYSYQARGYMALLFFSILIFYIACILIKNPYSRKIQIMYILSLTLGMYFHYFVLITAIILVLIGFTLFIYGNLNYRIFKLFIVLNIISGIIFIPEAFNAFNKYTALKDLDFIQNSFNPLIRSLFLLYGLFFGEAFKPQGFYLLIVIVFVVLIFFLLLKPKSS